MEPLSQSIRCKALCNIDTSRLIKFGQMKGRFMVRIKKIIPDYFELSNIAVDRGSIIHCIEKLRSKLS